MCVCERLAQRGSQTGPSHLWIRPMPRAPTTTISAARLCAASIRPVRGSPVATAPLAVTY